MGARRVWHGHKTLSLEDHFHFFTLHGRLPRNTQLRKFLRLDPEYDRATCLRLYRAPRNFPYCSSIAVSRLRFRCMPFLPRLLPNLFLEQIAQPGSRLMQLRFRISDGTTHDAGNLVVLVTLHIVQNKYSALARRKPFDRAFQVHSIHRPAQPQIRSAYVLPGTAALFVRLGRFLQGGYRERLFA